MVKPDRERYVWLYCPSVEDKRRYQELAEASSTPLSKYLIGLIEDALNAKEVQGASLALIKELEVLRAENTKLREELRLRNMIIEKLGSEAKKLRAETFLEPSFTGARKFDIELIELIRKGGPIQAPRLLERLNIDPTDLDAIEALSKRLEALESYQLIELTNKGWMWSK